MYDAGHQLGPQVPHTLSASVLASDPPVVIAPSTTILAPLSCTKNIFFCDKMMGLHASRSKPAAAPCIMWQVYSTNW